MKIVQLDIQGFRSLKNVSWRPGDLNVIIGPNGSGKSNLLRMLEMISAAARGKLADFVDASSGISQLVWDGQSNGIEFTLASSGTSLGNASDINTYDVKLRLVRATNYYIEHERLQNITGTFRYIDRNRTEGEIHYNTETGDSHSTSTSALSENETLLSASSSPFGWTAGTGLGLYQTQTSNWVVHQDIRTDQAAPIRQAPVSRLEQRVAPDGQNLINVLHTLYTGNRQFKLDINNAVSAAFGEDFDELIFPPAADQRIQMRVRWKSLKREQSTADLSDGTLRFLFLMTVLASPNPPPLIAIDEPETGLHPSMMPIIAEFAAAAATRTQVVFTTHSDRFLDAFRDVRPTTTVAKWENGETTLTTLDDAELAYWVEGYTLGSLFRSGELENMAS